MLVDWLLSIAPIGVILVLMVGLRWGALRAGPAGWLVAIGIAAARFGVGLEVLAYSQVKALLLTLDVLMIVWAAFLLYRVADEAGAIKAIGEVLPYLTADRAMQALLIGWAFASFLQGVGGFGVPVAVTAPLLVGLGFSPLSAVVIPTVGHGWAVTFGSLASSFQALMATTGLSGKVLAPPAALLLGLAGVGSGFFVAHAADGKRGVQRLAVPVLVLGLFMGVAQYGLATGGLWNIAGFGGGMAGLAAGVLLARRYRGRPSPGGAAVPNGRKLLVAMSGYLALVIMTLMVQLVVPLRELLGQVSLQVPFPEMRTSLGFVTPAGYGRRITFLRHAGAILLYASMAAYVIYRKAGMYSDRAVGRILKGTLHRVLPSSLGIAAMVSMAVLMAHAGMIDTLAHGLATAVGGLYPLASPWIGALGAFITGSNTNSNVLFALLQQRTADILGHSVPMILAAQTAGAAVGSVLAPTKIVVGASTTGLAGKEGVVLRATLVYIGLLIAGISLASWILLRIWPG